MTHSPRQEEFHLDKPLHVRLKHVTGSVTVVTTIESKCRLTLSAETPKGQKIVDSAVASLETRGSVAELDVRVGKDGDLGKGLELRLFGIYSGTSVAHRAAVNVLLEVPAGTSIDVKTVSGDVDCTAAAFGRIDFASVSGNLRCAPVDGSAKLQSVSGSLQLGAVRGSLDVETVSGAVTTGPVHGPIDIKTMSGAVRSCIAIPAPVAMKTVSGDIAISVVPDLVVAVDARSISGKVRSTIDLEGDPASEERSWLGGAVVWQPSPAPLKAPEQPAGLVSISAKSVSGDILVQTAATS